MTVMSLLLLVHLITSCKGYVNKQPWPVLLYKKGTQANIPCIIKGEAGAYFWKKGDTYQTSKHLAANVHGVSDKFANATHGKLTVTDNGTLIIYNISYEDDDTYFCRVVTEQSEHYASVTVYSQVSLHSFSLSIEQCSSLPGCKLHLTPGSRQILTCTASFVSSLVDLRWKDVHDNGATSFRKVKDNGDGSFNISVSTVVDYEKPSVLLCEANSPNMRGEVVTVEIESTQETENGPKTIIVVFIVIMVVLIITNITTGICFTMKLKQSKKHKEISGKDYEAVPSEESKKEIEADNKQLRNLREQLKKKTEMVTQLEADLESKNKQLKHQQEELESKDEEIQQHEQDLNRKDEEIKKQKKLADDKNEVINQSSKEIAAYKKAIKDKDSEIENNKKKMEEQAIIINQRNKQIGII